MQLEIVFTNDDFQRVADRYGESVATRVERKIEQKNETLQWKQTLRGAKKRFHNVVEVEGECFPEVMINSNGCRYRAILGWIESAQKFAFIIAVEKEEHYQTSRQHEIIDAINEDPHGLISKLEQKTAEKTESWMIEGGAGVGTKY